MLSFRSNAGQLNVFDFHYLGPKRKPDAITGPGYVMQGSDWPSKIEDCFWCPECKLKGRKNDFIISE